MYVCKYICKSREVNTEEEERRPLRQDSQLIDDLCNYSSVNI